MSPIRMLKLFSVAVIGWFAVADVHAAWFCPTCHVKHEEAICPNANTTDKFGIWQPTWWCDACQAIHFPKQWWWEDNKQLLVTCKNGSWPCQTCNTVHTAEDTFTPNAWCCPICRTKHTGGQSYCEQTQGNNTKEVWFCPSCNKPHGTYQPCESAWFCDECKKGNDITTTTFCSTCSRHYCSTCKEAYKATESCAHQWYCDKCTSKIKDPSSDLTCAHYWVCDTHQLRWTKEEMCSCGKWCCFICNAIYTEAPDPSGHSLQESLKNVPYLHAKKTFFKASPFNVDPLLNVFEEKNDPFKEVHSDGGNGKKKNSSERSIHSDGDQPNQPVLHAAEKLVREKYKKQSRSREEDLKEKSERSSSSSSSKDKNIKPHKKFVINTRKKDFDDEDLKDSDPKHPLHKTIKFREHSKLSDKVFRRTNKKQTNTEVQTSALEKTNTNGLKQEGNKPINSPKIELKSSKQSDEKKYPLLTQPHIKYSEKKEDPKVPSPKRKKEPSSNVSSDMERERNREEKQSSRSSSPKSKHKEGSASESDSDTSKSKLTNEKKEEKQELQQLKVERPKLQYNINLDALMNKIKEEPLSISGVSNFGKVAEMKEQSRIGELKLKLNRISNIQTSSKPKKDGASIVPSTSKVIKGGENKKEDDPFASYEHKTSKKQSTFNPSSSSSDSDESETPKGNAKNPKIYTNKPTDDLQKSVLKKIYKEDNGNETPSDSQSDSQFNLLKSSKNKYAAPNASDVNAKTKLPPASDSSQQFEFKAIEGPHERLKINENAPKSNNETPTPNGETPKEETPKSGKINASHEEKKSSSSKHVSKKSVTSTLKNEDQKSESGKQSDAEVSEKSDEENKSEKSNASDEEKKSSHSKFSKSSSKKSEKSGSEDEDSEKHSDSESLKSDKGSNKEGKSSEHNESSEEENEHSEEEEENSNEESENSETPGK